MEDPDAASPQPETPDPDPTSLQEAMQDPVNVWLGPVGPLLRKLHSLTASGHNLPDGISADEIDLLRDGLKKLCAPLQDMSEDEVDASVMARWWMKIVRELCYDTEDHLDEVVAAGAHLDFSEFLARVKDASKRGEGFQWWTIKPADGDRREAGVSRLTSPELPFPICGRSSTVGVAEPPKKLVDLLALDDDDKQTLKVISISGCAGVGKTTVARTLYHKHAGRFQCRAFVTVSRNPDTRGFLASMLSQLKAPRPHGFPDVPDLIDAISKHLHGKRYFIVIDALWLASIWNIISRAFPRGDYCSRIISTTQIDDVALACCSYDSGYIYMMEPLNDHESRKLFFGRVFGSEDGCPTDILEVSDMIIRKCGGLPLAIVDIASLLACESSIVLEKWKHVHDSLPSTSEGMKDFLNLICNSIPHLIYSSLPPRLRTCLLYLSMYPQGCVIKKDELVKLWVAEGFLSVVGGRDTQDIAEGYFAELVSRGMVQVVDTSNNGEVFSCTVHQTVLDYIRHKSMEKNFVITVDYFQSTVALSDKVRRLSVQFGGVKSAYIPETIVTSQVRSLIFLGFFECVPCSIKDYGLLRVLILHIWADEDNESFDLTGIGELFLLKYLKIECNITVELPDKIQGLQHLETLEVYAKVVAVPSDIGNMKRLLHLCLPSEYIQPSVVAHMTSLRTLRYIDLSRCSVEVEDVLHLGELTNLQDLQLICSKLQPTENLGSNVQLLGSILEKLSVLQSVTLAPAASGFSCVYIPQDGFSMASPPTRELLLRRIELSRHCCIFFSLPKWFGELRKLCILKIAIRWLSMNDTDVLKGLPALTALTLYIQTVSEERIVIDKGGFQVLTYFNFMCAAPCLSFAQGAMPKLQRLKIGFNSNKMKQTSFWLSGFCYLRGLTEVSVKLGVEDAHNFDIKGVESTLEAAVEHHTNSPIIIVQLIDVIFEGEEEESTETEGREENIQGIRDGKKKEDIPAADLLPQIQFHDSSMAKIDVRAFLLYSQLFLGDRPIKRNSLIRRWLAEGFASPLDPQSVSEQFCNLNNLIESSIIKSIHRSNGEISVRPPANGKPIWPPDLSRLTTLNHLGILDLRGIQTVTVYKEVLMLPRLKHLFGRFQLSKEDTPFVPVKGVVESDLEKFLRDKSELETLAGFVTGETLGFPQLMSIMKRLQRVKIWSESNASERNLIDLSKAITEFIPEAAGKPHFHRSLSIHFEGSSGEFAKNTVSVAGILDSLELCGELSQFPPFVAGLIALKEICFRSTGLSWEVIRDGLSRVRGLKYLNLIEDNLGSLDILSEAEHLKSIDRISVVCKQTLEVAIAARPLPNLVSLHILCQDLHAIPDNPIIDITCMVKIQEVALHHQVEDTIKDELLRTAKGHPNKPEVLFLEYPQ